MREVVLPALPSRMLNRPGGGPTRGLYQARRRPPSARGGLRAAARVGLRGALGRGRPLRGRLVEIGVEALLAAALALVGRGGRRRGGDGRGVVRGARAAAELRLAVGARGVARAAAAAARVAPEERRGVEGHLGRLEVAAVLALGLQHVV